ncbi:zinc ABC transporter substrate-binding protein [Lentisphaerota bacterium ZTH]|nr:zinc ABC transporter substrate-binding protein [Lentisphaerota bacterium]WET05129.1 zinc ABC transporter substrate-binding protein [Lentisphaerota bacterium ZTH]
MKLFRLSLLTLAALLTILFNTGCGKKTSTVKLKKGQMLIYTSIQPMAFMTAKIAGQYAVVKALIPAGKSPHDFSPSPSQIGEMSKARLYFTTGLPLEEKLVIPALKDSTVQIVDTTAGIQQLAVVCDKSCRCGQTKSSSGSVTSQVDRHVWLSPENNMIIAKNIFDAITAADPKHKDYYKLNFDNLIRCLKAVDQRLKKQLEPHRGEIFLVYHPAFGYFARQYNLKQEAVEFEGKKPSPAHLQAIINMAKEKNVHIIFVQPQFNKKSAEVIAAEIQGKVVELDPLAYNILENYTIIATSIQSAIKSEKTIENK